MNTRDYDSLSRPREPICAPPPPRRVTLPPLPPLRSRPVKAATLRAEAPLVMGGQGRTARSVAESAGAWAVCVMAVLFVALVAVLPRAAGWVK